MFLLYYSYFTWLDKLKEVLSVKKVVAFSLALMIVLFSCCALAAAKYENKEFNARITQLNFPNNGDGAIFADESSHAMAIACALSDYARYDEAGFPCASTGDYYIIGNADSNLIFFLLPADKSVINIECFVLGYVPNQCTYTVISEMTMPMGLASKAFCTDKDTIYTVSADKVAEAMNLIKTEDENSVGIYADPKYYTVTLMPYLFQSAAEIMESETTRGVALAAICADYSFAVSNALQTTPHEDFYITQGQDGLVTFYLPIDDETSACKCILIMYSPVEKVFRIAECEYSPTVVFELSKGENTGYKVKGEFVLTCLQAINEKINGN